MSEYPKVTPWGCLCGRTLMDLGPGAPDLICDDPNCTYDPFESGPVSPLDESSSEEQSEDEVNRPRHYTWVPGLEPIDLIEWLPYNLGAAAKYIVRCGHKKNAIQDLQKSVWYIQREISRLEKMKETDGRATH